MSKSITALKNSNEIRPLLSSLKLFLMTLTAVLKDYNMIKKGGLAVAFIEQAITLKIWTDVYFISEFCTLLSAKCS